MTHQTKKSYKRPALVIYGNIAQITAAVGMTAALTVVTATIRRTGTNPWQAQLFDTILVLPFGVPSTGLRSRPAKQSPA